MQERIDEIKELKTIYTYAYNDYQQAKNLLEKETLNRLLDDGLFEGFMWYISDGEKLVYQSHNIKIPIHVDLSEVLSLTRRIGGVHKLYRNITSFGPNRKVMLSISEYKAEISLPEDLTLEEFEKVVDILKITKLHDHGLEHGINKHSRELSNLLVMAEAKRNKGL